MAVDGENDWLADSEVVDGAAPSAPVAPAAPVATDVPDFLSESETVDIAPAPVQAAPNRMEEVAGGLVSGMANLGTFIQNIAADAPSIIPGVGMAFNVTKEALKRAGFGDGKLKPETVKRFLGAQGLPVAGINVEPTDTAGRFIVRISEEVGASLLPAAKFGGLVSGVGTSILSGAGAQAAKEVGAPEIVGQVAGALAAPAAAAGVRGVVRGTGETAAKFQSSLDDAATAGTGVSLGQGLSGWRQSIAAGIETVFGKLPGGGHVLSNFAKKQSAEMGSQLDDMAMKTSARIGPETAGRVLQKGVENFVGRFKDKANVLYRRSESHIPDNTPTVAYNYRSTLDDLAQPVQGAEQQSRVIGGAGSEFVSRLREANMADAPMGVMNFSSLKQLRSMIGSKLASSDLVVDASRAELKKLYGAITDDLRQAAQLKGPKALADFERANKYWKAGIGRIDDVLENISKRANPEDAFTAVMNRSKVGSTTIRAMRRSTTPEEWDVVVSNVLKRMGAAPASSQGADGSEFFAGRMLTDWNNISPNAKSAMFGGTRYARMAKDLDAIARTAEKIKQGPSVLANPNQATGQGTGMLAGTLFVGTAVGGLPALAATIGGITVATGAATKLMTSPKFLRWLARGTKISANEIPAHLARLSNTMRSEDSETKMAVKMYIDALDQSMSEPE